MKVWRGYQPHKKPPAKGTHPLVLRLMELMKREQINETELAEKTGLHRLTIQGWHRSLKKRRVGTPGVAALEACYNVLGYTLSPVLRDDDGSDTESEGQQERPEDRPQQKLVRVLSEPTSARTEQVAWPPGPLETSARR